MIYLDTAATSYVKAPSVYQRVQEALTSLCANPGRSGHAPALAAGRAIYQVREQVSQFLGVGNPDRVIFTSNATDSLNLAIQGMAKPNGHIVVTSMEHNSVLRPVVALEKQGITHTIVYGDPHTGLVTAEQIANALRPETCLVVCTHASNVTGTLMPVAEIGSLCRREGIPFLVDVSQSVGACPVRMDELNADLLACPGHKGLLGLTGTGLLCLGENILPTPLKQGGTGSFSELLTQPDLLPDCYESGTLNTIGIAALGAGIEYLEDRGIEKIYQHEKQLCTKLLQGLQNIPGITIYGCANADQQAAVVAFNLPNMDCSQVAYLLDTQYQICVRAGLHCAPLAHKTVGSFPSGAVRMSIGPFNSAEDIDAALDAIETLCTAKNV